MKKSSMMMLMMAVVLLFTLGQSAWAFSDTEADPNAAKIADLKTRGIISGENGKFIPKGKLTNAAAVSLLVKGFDLNIDDIRFIKEPKASDYFTNVDDNAWYADAFIIASLRGLDIPKDIHPAAEMTREQFAHSLFQAMLTTGDYAFIELFIMIEDEADINPDYMNSIQKIVISKFAELDKDNKFHPKAPITRSDAASWLHAAIKFVETTDPVEPLPEPETPSFPLYDVKLGTEAVNKDIQAVTVTAQAPHPGYGIKITSIAFKGDTAVITVEAISPDPDMIYPQVITEIKATTYISSQYKPVLAELADGAGSSDSEVFTNIVE